ncbi:hypothetical protein GCWU000323_02631 [Leptotrichia hofstadii F0254]|uniref:Uncharacterized protein n=1 Tax=Leptotrichia hofstadii F0254 TaxID=634994 RepID=C9N1B0_9FUSO|nr:hypothetical protein GCWU000323_02631 [Leptotrichia hofstadii F0254]
MCYNFNKIRQDKGGTMTIPLASPAYLSIFFENIPKFYLGK